ncbi:hypothetical protein LMG3441_03948 [Achromobacter kerstersii]|uniref:Uncharacterized protein n=1 Tax=Achromobacter kerstersii TaxID=1353890 RepID=A0A6S7B918_9BURK|nr:hypothetical protein LMG3441_03948 [Achromobacter kerstersii]
MVLAAPSADLITPARLRNWLTLVTTAASSRASSFELLVDLSASVEFADLISR